MHRLVQVFLHFLLQFLFRQLQKQALPQQLPITLKKAHIADVLVLDSLSIVKRYTFKC